MTPPAAPGNGTLGAGAPFGHDPRVPEGYRPADEAPADLSSLAACALPWPTARLPAPAPRTVARPDARPYGACPGPAPTARRSRSSGNVDAPACVSGRRRRHGSPLLREPRIGRRPGISGPASGARERFALAVTGPARDADGDRLATAHSAHAHVPMGEGAPVRTRPASAGRAPPGARGAGGPVRVFPQPTPCRGHRYSISRPRTPGARSLNAILVYNCVFL